MASIKENFIYDLLNNVTGLLFPLITFPYISRILNPQGIGEVAFAQSVISYFVMFAALGIPTYALREVAKYRNDKLLLSKFTFEIFIIHATLSIIAFILALSLYFVSQIKEIWFVYLIASTHIVLNFLGFNWFFQGVEEFKFITIRVLIFRITSLILLFSVVHESSDIYWYMAILVLSEVGNNICNMFMLRKYVLFKEFHIGHLDCKQHFKPIVSLFLLSISTMIYFNMDNLMIGFIQNDMAVGYYNPALRIQRMLMGFVLSLGTVLFPRLSSLASSDKDKFKILSKQGFNVTLGVSLPIVFGIYALGKPMILLFAGAEFVPSILTLYLLAPVIVLGTCSNLIAKIMISQDKERIVLIATSVGAVANLLLNSLLIYYYSQYGAAVASSLSEMFVLSTLIIVGRRFLPKSFLSVDSFKYLIASAIMCSAVYGLEHCLDIPEYMKCISGLMFGIVVYYLILVLLKERYVISIMIQSMVAKLPKA